MADKLHQLFQRWEEKYREERVERAFVEDGVVAPASYLGMGGYFY